VTRENKVAKFETHGKTHEPANERRKRQKREQRPKRVIVRALSNEPEAKTKRQEQKQEREAKE
jgi:hypothetical protein